MLGTIKDAKVLVGYGIGHPTHFVSWLEALMMQFARLQSYADAVNRPLPIESNYDFIERLGLEQDVEHLEINGRSGSFFTCRMPMGAKQTIQTEAASLLKDLENRLMNTDIDGLFEAIIDKTRRIRSLTLALEQKKRSLERFRSTCASDIERLTLQYQQQERLHFALLEQDGAHHDKPYAVGPFLFVGDKVLTAVHFGGQALPDGFYRWYWERMKARQPQRLIDVRIRLDYTPNFHCPRRLVYQVTSPDRWDTVWVKQRSITPPRYRITLDKDPHWNELSACLQDVLQSRVDVVVEKGALP